MQRVSEWATANHPVHALTICTDRQSLLNVIAYRSSVTHHLTYVLNTRSGPTTLLWIPVNKGSPGNELADTEAKAAAKTTSDLPRPIFRTSAISLIRTPLIDPPQANSQAAEVYGGFTWSKDCMAISNRADAALFARIRGGHTPLLKAYANLLDPSVDPCPPFAKRSRGQLSTGCRDAPGSMQLERHWKSFSTSHGPTHLP